MTTNRYTLFDYSHPIRTENNIEGLRLYALFRVNTGDRIAWTTTDEHPEVAVKRGDVNGKARFTIALDARVK